MQWQFLTSGFLSYVKEEVFLKGAILKQDKETISTILCHYATASSLFFFFLRIYQSVLVCVLVLTGSLGEIALVYRICHFHDVLSPMVTDFFLAMWCQWMESWEEMCLMLGAVDRSQLKAHSLQWFSENAFLESIRI